MNYINIELGKRRALNKSTKKQNRSSENEKIDKTISAFQELYELTQRKLLHRIAQIAAKMDIGIFPRLIYIDLIEKSNLEAWFSNFEDESTKNLLVQQNAVIETEEMEFNDGSRYRFSADPAESDSTLSMGANAKRTPFVVCLRVMCAYETGWHQVESYAVLGELKNEYCPYLSRMMNLLKR
jgi:hypothetical protein